jgi:hypothetical protein
LLENITFSYIKLDSEEVKYKNKTITIGIITTMRHVAEPMLSRKKNKLYIFLVCVYLLNVYLFSRGKASDIEVMVGNIKLSRRSPSKLADVERIYIHEEYGTDGRKFDVALLKV